MNQEPVRVGLLWHSPNSSNLGVGALTLANMDLIRRAAAAAGRSVDFTILGFADEAPVYPQLRGVRTLALGARQTLSPSYASAVRGCDLVVDIGGGDSFADIYGLKRFGYLAVTKAIALALGRPLVLAPQTLGPFASTPVRLVAEGLIARSRAAFARDEASVRALVGAAARRNVTVTTDVAFALPYEPAPKAEGRARVGFNVSALLYHGGYTGQNQFGLRIDYPAFVRRVIEALKGRPGVELVLVPHVIAPHLPVEDDLALCRRLAAEAGLPEPPRFADPVAAKSYISGCDVLVGSRMHACIAAVSSGVAAAPVAYSRKFAGLFDAIGYTRTIDARQVETDAAVEGVLAVFEEREAVAREAVAATATARAKLETYVTAVTDLVRTL